jgi:uncharacterized membrane protein YdjX (TVP38/TMEM64 family)
MPYKTFNKQSQKRIWLVFLLTLLILLLQLRPVLAYDTELTPEELAAHAPKNHVLAVIFMLIAFALKSLIFVVPIPVLYLASGLIFDPVTAFVLNFFGMLVCTAVPYWIGRFSGAGLFQKLIKRYPKLQVLDTFQHQNQWFISFMVRAVGFLPCDAVSLVLGAWKISFLRYLSGTALGMLPGLIATTMVGITITNPRSPGFILSVAFTILISVGSFAFWRLYQKARIPHISRSAFSAGLDLQYEQDENDQVDNEYNENN